MSPKLTTPRSGVSRSAGFRDGEDDPTPVGGISAGDIAGTEVALSILLTSASIYGIVWVTSRIYRIGVLMYGKRPNIPEILRWLKYS